jgi:hypothetical protein
VNPVVIGGVVAVSIVAVARVIVGMFSQPSGWIKGQPPAPANQNPPQV